MGNLKRLTYMKMIRLPLGIWCVVLALLCCSCGLFGEQRYKCEVDNIASIQIVRLDTYVEGEYRYEYTVLSEISDYTVFVDRLNSVKHSVNWGDPYQLDVEYVVIKINYHNGDYDLIHSDAQWFNRSGTNQVGYFFFDEEQFNTLISDYTKTMQQ